MNANSTRPTPDPSSKPFLLTSAAAVLVLVGFTIGAAQSGSSGRDGTAAPSQHDSRVGVIVGDFEYFPAQYVNRANELDDHIQAF